MGNKKYVVLEHLTLPDRGFRFWTSNSENNTHGSNGELWYEEVLFTDSKEEAISVSRNINVDALPKYWELLKYHKEKNEKKSNVVSANIE